MQAGREACLTLRLTDAKTGAPIRDLESFQDSGNPGYFLVKVALWVMAAAVLGQSLVDIFRTLKADDK